MAVISSTKDFWMHQNGLTFSINYFGNPQLIQTSLLAGAVILAYRKDVIGYNAAHNFREWKLQAFPTQLSDTCTYYVHVELSRTGNTAMVIYSPVIRDMQGRTLLSGNRVSGTYDDNVSADSWFIYIGTLSASVDSDGNTVERAWTDGVYTGTLATDQYRMEEASGDWVNMFSLNSVTGLIDVLKTISKATINALTVAKEFIFGGKTLTGVAGTDEAGDDSKVNDSTLPTTGYVQKEIEALDDHFLIKDDPDTEQSVAGPVTFEQDVTVQGDHAVEGVQTIGKGEPGNINVEKVVQEVKGKQILHGGFQTPNFNNAAGQITGAHLTPDGKLYVSGLKANNLEIDELVFNVVKAQGGEYVYSTSCEIESCIYVMEDGSQLTPDAFYALPDHDWQQIAHVLITLKEDEFTKYGNPFVVGDIIYGKVNKVQESGKHAVGGECIMHITDVDYNTLNITAELYQVGVEGVVGNIPPIEDMVIAHRGNCITHDENDNEINIDRRTSFYLSTITGNIVMLYNVTTPTISTVNYGASFGKLPSDLFDTLSSSLPVQSYDPVVYAKYGIFENFIQKDHEGGIIQSRRDRGQWSKAVAEGDVKYRYKNEVNYYDTVTHNGELWKILKSNSTVEPSLYSPEDWLRLVARGTDGTSYWLYTNAPHVHINADGEADVSAINITVYKSSEEGIVALTTQEELDAEGLLVQYSIDSTAPRTDMELEDEGYIELEDGSGSIIGESDNQTTYLYTESAAIPFDDVDKFIMFWLYDTNANKDIDSLKVEISRDGTSDDVVSVEYAYSTSDSMSDIPTSWQTEKPSVTAGYYLWTRVTYSSGKVVYTTSYNGKDGASGKPIYITGTKSTIIVDTAEVIGEDGTTSVVVVKDCIQQSLLTCMYNNEATKPVSTLLSTTSFVTKTDVDKNVIININIPANTNVNKIPSEVIVTMSVDDEGTSISATFPITILQSKRGLEGPQGEAGPLYVPFGTWSESDAKLGKYDVDTEQALPLVRHDGAYYIHGGDNDLIKNGTAPNETNSGWKWATSQHYVLAEMLMANFAKLGSEFGAIFYHKYLFSQYGKALEVDGNIHYADYYDKMFTDGDDPTLTGDFVPNLFIDFLNGTIKTNRLSEMFRPFRNAIEANYGDGVLHADVRFADLLSLATSYNLKSEAGGRLLCMPLLSDIKTSDGTVLEISESDFDGVHSTITMLPNIDYERNATLALTNSSGVSDDYLWPAICKKSLIVCADPRYFNKKSYRYGLDGYADKVMFAPTGDVELDEFGEVKNSKPDMFFSINGTLTKWLLLEHGTTAILRLVKGGEANIWIVENAGDFSQLPVTISIGLDRSYQEGTGVVEEGSTWSFGGVIGEGSFNTIDTDFVLGKTVVGRLYGSNRLRKLYEKSDNQDTAQINITIQENKNSDVFIDEISSIY